MADDWFAGEGGAAGGTGVDWTNRVATITQLLALGFAAGDSLYVGPGVYREAVTMPVGGSTVYSTGTVGVTNESTAVTGAGGADFTATPVLAGDELFIGNLVSETDGQGNGTTTFTSASAPFDADMVGFMIEIIGAGAYLIDSFNSTSSIELDDRNGVGLPGAGGNPYTFYVVMGEGPYRVASVDGAAALTLEKPWSGPTVSGLAYEIYRPVYLIGDVSGEMTDGIGGVVRLTGTDDDTTDPGAYDRANGFTFGATDDYWHLRGFTVTTHSAYGYYVNGPDMVVIEDAIGIDNAANHIRFDAGATRIIARRTISVCGIDSSWAIFMTASGTIDNSQRVVENAYAYCGNGIRSHNAGGTTVKNLTMGFQNDVALNVTNMQAGNATCLRNSLIHFCAGTDAVTAGGNGMVIETYNNYWQNADDLHANVSGGTVSAPDTEYPHLPMLPMLTGHSKTPMTFFAPSQWEATRDATGVYPANMDLFGVHNEVAQTRRSWGAMHNYATLRSTTQAQGSFAGSIYLEDSMEQQFVFPVKESWGYDVTVWVYLEANYTGNAPEMVVSQPGLTSVTATSTGAIGSWHQISVSVTTGAALDWITVSLRSNNTASGVLVGTYFQDLRVN